jgi:hypothetical protein
VCSARAFQTQQILRDGISVEDRIVLERYCDSLPGVLGELWKDFLALAPQKQIDALGQPEFAKMSWQSLLQCNPFAMLKRWVPIKPQRPS